MVILSLLVGGTMKMLLKNFLKHFVFDRTIFEKGPHFPKIMFIYEVKGNTNILNQDVQKKAYIYLIFFLNN